MNFELRHPQPPAPLLPASQSCDLNGSGCKSLASITIPKSVCNIFNSAFSDCTSLTNVTIPDGISSISRSLFEGCTNLISVRLPDSIMDIEDSAFSNCPIIVLFPLHQKSRTSDNSDKARLPSSDERCHR